MVDNRRLPRNLPSRTTLLCCCVEILLPWSKTCVNIKHIALTGVKRWLFPGYKKKTTAKKRCRQREAEKQNLRLLYVKVEKVRWHRRERFMLFLQTFLMCYVCNWNRSVYMYLDFFSIFLLIIFCHPQVWMLSPPRQLLFLSLCHPLQSQLSISPRSVCRNLSGLRSFPQTGKHIHLSTCPGSSSIAAQLHKLCHNDSCYQEPEHEVKALRFIVHALSCKHLHFR